MSDGQHDDGNAPDTPMRLTGKVIGEYRMFQADHGYILMCRLDSKGNTMLGPKECVDLVSLLLTQAHSGVQNTAKKISEDDRKHVMDVFQDISLFCNLAHKSGGNDGGNAPTDAAI